MSAPVVRELRGAFLTCVGSLVGRLPLIRGREQACDSSLFRLVVISFTDGGVGSLRSCF